jgi:hypothetical protein
MKSIKIRMSLFHKFYSSGRDDIQLYGYKIKRIGYLDDHCFNTINFQVLVNILPGRQFVECTHIETKLIFMGLIR